MPRLQRVLIANRGEIAVRIIRTLRETGRTSIAIFSDPDRTALHVLMADEAYPVGPGPSRESYLDLARVIETARRVKADAIHPGYGFFAENEAFARACAAAGIVFIGPSPETIAALGDKLMARKAALAAVVPVVPGAPGPVDSRDDVKRLKEENGARDIDERKVGRNDVVCGIAASLRTPYVVGAVKRAKEHGAKTLYVTTNPRSKFYSPEFAEIAQAVDVAICPEVGPEVIMGSTRMKSGTAQKLVLNMITTASMVRLGKVYENMMIDLQMTNEKLRERSKLDCHDDNRRWVR